MSGVQASASSRRKAVFLDRDGVLIRAIVRDGRPYSARTLVEAELLPGVREACAALREAGALLIVVTNQPDVARGDLDADVLESLHHWLRYQVELDDIRMCTHDDGDACTCRKPKPGMITTAARELGIDVGASVMVGDRWRDVQAGREAGCRTVFVDRGYREQLPFDPDLVVHEFPEAVPWIVNLWRVRGSHDARDN